MPKTIQFKLYYPFIAYCLSIDRSIPLCNTTRLVIGGYLHEVRADDGPHSHNVHKWTAAADGSQHNCAYSCQQQRGVCVTRSPRLQSWRGPPLARCGAPWWTQRVTGKQLALWHFTQCTCKARQCLQIQPESSLLKQPEIDVF